tara:strand:+ start:1232 stop:1447 length:216 start_codon:yes stop_codon:yes gene_type:complete
VCEGLDTSSSFGEIICHPEDDEEEEPTEETRGKWSAIDICVSSLKPLDALFLMPIYRANGQLLSAGSVNHC